MIISTDWHLTEDSADIVLGHVLPGLAQAAIAARDPFLVCLGDVWHFRYRASVRLQVALRDELQRHAKLGLKWRFLPGNHDMFDINGRNIMELFHGVSGVEVVSAPMSDEHGVWIPYQISNSKFLDEFDAAHRMSGSRVAFVHQGFKGALMNDTHADEHGLDPTPFKGWRVISGHYHKRQTLGAITYVGSPYQTSMSEAGQDKGYAHWDGKTLTPVTTAWGPRHFKIEAQSVKDIDPSQFRPQDVVSVTTGAGANVAAIGKKLAAAGIVNHTVTPEVEKTEARLAISADASFEEYAAAYVGVVAPPELDKARILATFKGLTQ